MHQSEKLVKSHQVVVKWHRLNHSRNPFPTARSKAAHWVLPIVVVLYSIIGHGFYFLYQQVLFVFFTRLIHNNVIGWCTSLHNILIAQKWNGSEFACRHSLFLQMMVDNLCDRGLRTEVHVNASTFLLILVIVVAQIQKALPNADYFLKSAVTVHIVCVAKVGVYFCQLIQQLFFVVSLHFLRSTLTHFFLIQLSINNINVWSKTRLVIG